MSQRRVIIHGVSSKRTHEENCTWIQAQMHNPNLRLIVRDSYNPTDDQWWKDRAVAQQIAMITETPLPLCTYCSCPV